jgi:hypothetical protein
MLALSLASMLLLPGLVKNGKWAGHHWLNVVGGWMFSIFAILCLLGFTHHFFATALQRVFLGFWLVGPPVAFWIQYYLLAPKVTEKQRTDPRMTEEEKSNIERTKNELARFNDFRQVSVPIWAGIAAALAAAYVQGKH